jgi:putative peptidoglycan lipid II flippase
MPSTSPPTPIENKSAGLWRKIGIASAIMMASIFLSRVMGLVREMVIAGVAGANAAVDAYRVAFIVPEILNHMVASGFMAVTFIPIFTRYLAEDRMEEGWRAFSLIMTVFGTLLLLMIAVAEVLTPQLIAVLAPGRNDPAFVAMTVRMTRIILPAQFFFFAGGLMAAVQYAQEKFFFPALAPLVYNLGIIGGGVLLASSLGMEGFAWGVLGGALIGNFALQIKGARRVGLRFTPVWDWRHADLWRYLRLTLPLMLGLTMMFSTEIFTKFFGSYLPAGSIAWIDYAMRIMLMLVAFFGQAVGIATYPFMARMAAEGRLAEMNQLLNDTLRYLCIVLPFAVLIIVLREEVVTLLYMRGRFTRSDVLMTAPVLGCLMLGAIAFASQTVVNRGFYATQNTLLPALYGTLAVVVSVPLYYIGMQSMGLVGVGLAVSFSALAQVVLLYVIWNRRSRNAGSGAVYRFFFKMVLLSVPLWAVLRLLRNLIAAHVAPASTSGCLITAALVGGAFLILLFILGYGLRIREIKRLLERLPGWPAARG